MSASSVACQSAGEALRARTRDLALAAALLWWTAAPAAHDVPNDVRIQVFLKPEGQRLRLLVRAPLASMNDISWPTAGVFLNLARSGDDDRAERGREGLDRRPHRDLRGRRPPWRSAPRRGPRVAAVRHLVRFLRRRAAIPAWPGAAGRHRVVKSQAMVDALFEYPIRSDRSRFSIDPHYRLLGLRALTVLRFVTPDGAERALEFHDDPGLVRLDPRWFQAVRLFVVEGVRHILSGTDHLLFLFCLVIPFRRFRQLLVVVTAFTVAHSITLIASAYDMGPDAGWFPPLVETLIAASIVYMALENILAPGADAAAPLADRVRFRTRARLRLLVRAARHHAAGRLAPADLAAVVQPRRGDRSGGRPRRAASGARAAVSIVVAERPGTIVLSAIVAHTGWHWMIDRGRTALPRINSSCRI